ncbi:Chaperone protein DnaJ [Lasiodiplodia theobromae]|uniref:Chaperone protein DnaJ n=1 Tax=Lasiodiplodia theobromae TaxID=45133 RepID=A0A5N5D7I7_9PEZI|nr:Chaperone protein DnaJ [Lasiodiplodia theobromae]
MANPSEPPDHYATLGIPPTASLPDIRRAYHAQALLHHPDRNRDQTAVATERFQQVRHVPPHSKRAIIHHHHHHTSTNPSAPFQISLAWQTLSSTSSKRDYDLSRPSAPSSSSPPSTSDPPPPTPSPSSNPHTRLCLLRAQLAHLDALDTEHARERQLRAAAALPSWPWKWRPPAPATEEEEARLEVERLERATVRRVKLAEVEELERVVGREKEEEKGVREKEEKKGVREKEEEERKR